MAQTCGLGRCPVGADDILQSGRAAERQSATDSGIHRCGNCRERTLRLQHPAGSSGRDFFADYVSSGRSGAQSQGAQNANPPDPMAAIPGTGYFVQVAAVTKQDDADALVDALKKKQYPAFVASNAATDKLFRVQVGPFGDIKEAEAMRSRLINDGYNPILKK
jgi:hypothetical protein